MGNILIIAFVIGFFMSDKKEKFEFFKEVISTLGGIILVAIIIIFILDKFDILSSTRSIYFLKRILFGNPF